MNAKSDVFSFAIVCWEIFSFGEMPYKYMDNRTVIKWVKEGNRMPIPQNTPDVIKQVIIIFYILI